MAFPSDTNTLFFSSLLLGYSSSATSATSIGGLTAAVQISNILTSVSSVLTLVGFGKGNIAYVTLYLKSASDYAAVASAYTAFMTYTGQSNYPPLTVHVLSSIIDSPSDATVALSFVAATTVTYQTTFSTCWPCDSTGGYGQVSENFNLHIT